MAFLSKSGKQKYCIEGSTADSTMLVAQTSFQKIFQRPIQYLFSTSVFISEHTEALKLTNCAFGRLWETI